MAENPTEAVDTYKEELFEKFYSKLPDSYKPTEIYTQVRAAYDFAYDAHYGVTRKGGDHEPYITHPVEVALIVANEIGLGVSSVVAALLHDVVEDTEFTKEDIKKIFGESVATIVEGLTKMSSDESASVKVQAETFKKMLLSIPRDPRVAFIKIADRLHNMRTMEDMPDGTRQIKAGENHYVYIPIAEQLGLYDIKNELEDFSFKYVHPRKYADVQKAYEESAERINNLYKDFQMALMRVLVKTGHVCKLSVITKSFYQAWHEMNETGKNFSEIDNYKAVRIIFDPEDIDNNDEIVSVHYKLYASVITNFPERIDSKRDYVITPKKNGFKALVFMVMFDGNWIEVQIVTASDDLVARRGYSKDKPNRMGLDVLKEKLSGFNKNQDAVELLNRFRSLSFSSTIFVYTPKGSMVELPQGATVLDCAYAIHENLGNHCLGAYVGQRLVPIDFVLSHSVQVQLLTSPSTKPSTQWFNYITSDHSKVCLDRYFKFKNNIQNDKSDVIKGRQDFNKLLRDNRVIPNLLLSGKILSYYKLPNNEELYKRIANSEIKLDDLLACILRLRTIIDGSNPQRRKVGESSPAKVEKPKYVEINYKKPLHVDKSIPYMLASCCHPIPGDDALACTDDDGMLFIHKRECVNAKKLIAIDGKKTTKVAWGENFDDTLVSVFIQGTDKLGLLKDVSSLLCDSNVNVKSVQMNVDDGVFSGTLGINIKTVADLERIIKQLHEIQGIVRVNRTNNRDGRIIAVK